MPPTVRTNPVSLAVHSWAAKYAAAIGPKAVGMPDKKSSQLKAIRLRYDGAAASPTDSGSTTLIAAAAFSPESRAPAGRPFLLEPAALLEIPHVPRPVGFCSRFQKTNSLVSFFAAVTFCSFT